MTAHGERSAVEIRAQLRHPVIDGDGHWREPLPVFLEYLASEGGPGMVERFRASGRADWYSLSSAERLSKRVPRSPWWGAPAGARDLATAMVPGVMYDRLDELGFDYSIIYTTLGLQMPLIRDDDLRIASLRALNEMNHEAFDPYRDRMTPAAVISTFTPAEAVAGVHHAVEELGFKVIMLSGTVPRPLRPDGDAFYVDTISLDSPYDYEEFWSTCVRLKVAVTDHGGSWYWPDRMSPTNMVFNHVGHFANQLHASCRGLILGGVLARHPELSVGFLEGGVGWANTFLGELLGHYEKRNWEAMQLKVPTRVDMDEFKSLYRAHARGKLAAAADDIFNSMNQVALATRERDCVNDFAAGGLESGSDICKIFENSFYFGCEADDPMTILAFDERMPARLRPFFSSDISHFDVPVMAEVLPEAWEMVEHGHLSEDDFEEFTFKNAVLLHRTANSDFFQGTSIEAAAEKIAVL